MAQSSNLVNSVIYALCIMAFTAGCLIVFGFTVYFRVSGIAPRTRNRPSEAMVFGNLYKSSEEREQEAASRQKIFSFWRLKKLVNCCVGWIPHVLRLSYDEMITGVEGTGSRDVTKESADVGADEYLSPREGTLLKVNLDGIVIDRFHEMGLKITFWVCLISMTVALPTNFTANCYNDNFSFIDANYTDEDLCPTNMTEYLRTTIANIPNKPRSTDSFMHSQYSELWARAWALVLCVWAITYITCRILWKEWEVILKLRREYYTEEDHFGNYCVHEGVVESLPPNESWRDQTYGKPWLSDPDKPDTVPSVELYSVLIGNLPTKPTEVVEDENDGFVDLSARKKALEMIESIPTVEWQLAVTSAMFDTAVSSEKYFTSSVAAVTIMPDPEALGRTWQAWNIHVKRTRRLRYIRSLLEERNVKFSTDDEHEDGGGDDDDEEENLTVNFPMADKTRVPFMGPAQHNLYSRELAQASSICCPLTPACCTEKYSKLSTDELVTLEKDLLEEALESSRALRNAQNSAIEKSNKNAEKTAARMTKQQEKKKSDGRFGKSTQPQQLTSILAPPGSSKKTHLPRVNSGNSLNLSVAEGNTPMKARHRPNTSSMDKDLELGITAKGLTYDTSRGGLTPVINRTPKRPSEITDSGADEEGAKGSKEKTELVRRKSLSVNIADADIVFTRDGKLTLSPFNESRAPSLTTRTRAESFATPPRMPSAARKRITSEDMKQWGVNLKSPVRARALTKESSNSADFGLNADEEDEKKKQCNTRFRNLSVKNWALYPVRTIYKPLRYIFFKIFNCMQTNVDLIQDKYAKSKNKNTFAVVTFTSRQAAATARQCVIDGRGTDRWKIFKNHPVTPLADAAAYDIKTCRNCCRPVTLSISKSQKKFRKWVTITALIFVYLGYTIPILFTTNLVDKGVQDIPFLSFITTEQLSGWMTSLFLTAAPYLFKAIANFGSGATSLANAEHWTLHFYWYFMLTICFTGSFLAGFLIQMLSKFSFINISVSQQYWNGSLRDMFQQMSYQIPDNVAIVWLNYMTIRVFVTLPGVYLLQSVSAAWYFLCCMKNNCCSRIAQGGGTGAPFVFRNYVDSAFALLLGISFSVISPLVTVLSFLTFLVSVPLWRRQLILVHRPRFDTGGRRWPLLSNMVFSGLLVSQLVIGIVLAFKNFFTAAFCCIISIILTFDFMFAVKREFLAAFNEAGLMQAGLLDDQLSGGAESEVEGFEREVILGEKEKFRKWLVDSHKAAFISPCMYMNKTIRDKLTTTVCEVIDPDN